MAAQLSLRISLEGGRVTKTIQFDPNTTVFDACRIIRDKFAEAVQGQGEFPMFFNLTRDSTVVSIQQPLNMVCSCRMKTIAKAFGWNPVAISAITCCATSTSLSTAVNWEHCAWECSTELWKQSSSMTHSQSRNWWSSFAQRLASPTTKNTGWCVKKPSRRTKISRTTKATSARWH